MRTRAQSELVGVVILVGVFAVLATIVGVAIIGNVSDQARDAPLVDINATATPSDITLVHAGGDGLDPTAVDVVVRRDSEIRYDLTDFSEVDGGDPSAFTPGERWERSHTFGAGPLAVAVVHVPTNEVLYQETIDAR